MDFADIFGDALRAAFGPSAAIYAIAAIGLNIHFGYTGLLNFGQVGFMLVGAYGVSVTVATFGGPLWLGVIVGILAAVVLALILGIPTLRLRADYLAIATIATGEILRFIYRSNYAEPLTGGVYGLQRFADSFYALNPFGGGRYGIGPVTYSGRALWVMTVAWGIALLATLLVFLLIHSPWGRVIKSIREDEDAARSLGKNVYSYKMQSLVLGGVLGAIGGMMLAISAQSAHPDDYQPVVTFYLYAIVILGGAGRVITPIIGSIIFWFILAVFDTTLRQMVGSGVIPPGVLSASDIGALRFALVGLGLMLLMIFRPAGLMGNRKEMMLDAR